MPFEGDMSMQDLTGEDHEADEDAEDIVSWTASRKTESFGNVGWISSTQRLREDDDFGSADIWSPKPARGKFTERSRSRC
jgi:hypothetical protein